MVPRASLMQKRVNGKWALSKFLCTCFTYLCACLNQHSDASCVPTWYWSFRVLSLFGSVLYQRLYCMCTVYVDDSLGLGTKICRLLTYINFESLCACLCVCVCVCVHMHWLSSSQWSHDVYTAIEGIFTTTILERVGPWQVQMGALSLFSPAISTGSVARWVTYPRTAL